MALVVYNGGFRSFVTKFDDFEDVQVWQKIWSSSVPLWSILISNFGILIISLIVIQSKKLFIKFPKKPVNTSTLLLVFVVYIQMWFMFFLFVVGIVDNWSDEHKFICFIPSPTWWSFLSWNGDCLFTKLFLGFINGETWWSTSPPTSSLLAFI